MDALHSGEGGEEAASATYIPSLLAEKDGAQRVEAFEVYSLAEADGDSIAGLDAGEKAVEVQGHWKAVVKGARAQSWMQRRALMIYEGMSDDELSFGMGFQPRPIAVFSTHWTFVNIRASLRIQLRHFHQRDCPSSTKATSL